jgi:DNA-dependent protein kinase catalytic subunit
MQNPVAEIQWRIIRLLGKLGGENIHLIGEVNLLAPGTESDMAWDTEPLVKLVLPFHDMKPELYLGRQVNKMIVILTALPADGILPQIVDLARDANDRQTKVAACELLHAIVLYMVGTNAHQPQPVCVLICLALHCINLC